MVYLAGLIVIATFVLIIKKYEAKTVLMISGFIMCLLGGFAKGAIDINGPVNAFVAAMIHKTLVPTICTVMGSAYVMKATKCDQHLVHSISPLLKLGRPILIPLGFFLTWWINIAIPSAAGCAAAVGTILIPTLIAAGVHPAMAGATVLAGLWGSSISPGTSHNPVVATLINADVMTVILHEAPMAIGGSFTCAIVLTALAYIKKEGATEERRKALEAAAGASDDFKVNPMKAIVPLVPIVLLVLGSKQVGVLPPVGVPLAMLTGVVLGMIVAMLNPQKGFKEFFDGMGSGYGSVLGLIAAAGVFSAGMTAAGLTGALIELMKGSESIASIAGTFGPYLIAIVCGSGDAAAVAFNTSVTPHAAQFGLEIIDLGSMAQIGGAIGRSMSPVAGCAIVCAGIAKVAPMEMVKRTALPCLLACITVWMLF